MTGTTTYTVVDEETIVIEPFTISVNAGVSYDLSGATLLRDDSVFYGTITNLSNGAQYDSLIFSIALTDIPDLDSDGIPDITDSEITASGFIDWLNVGAHETVPFGETAPTRHWSYTLKAIDYDGAAPSTAWFRELGAYIFVATESGTKSMDGVWAYAFDWPVDGAGGTWIWMSVNNFNTRVETGGDVIEGWLYLAGAPYAKWFFVKEFDTIGADSGTYLFVTGESYRLTNQP